jgi:hypothetical protein
LTSVCQLQVVRRNIQLSSRSGTERFRGKQTAPCDVHVMSRNVKISSRGRSPSNSYNKRASIETQAVGERHVDVPRFQRIHTKKIVPLDARSVEELKIVRGDLNPS